MSRPSVRESGFRQTKRGGLTETNISGCYTALTRWANELMTGCQSQSVYFCLCCSRCLAAVFSFDCPHLLFIYFKLKDWHTWQTQPCFGVTIFNLVSSFFTLLIDLSDDDGTLLSRRCLFTAFLRLVFFSSFVFLVSFTQYIIDSQILTLTRSVFDLKVF